MEEELRLLLLPLAPVSWGSVPQGTIHPYLVLTRISGGRQYATGGEVGPDGIRVQVDCYAMSYGTARELSRRVIKTVDGRRVGNFEAIFVDSDRDLTQADASGNATQYRISVDLILYWQE